MMCLMKTFLGVVVVVVYKEVNIMAKFNVNGRENSLIIYVGDCSKELWAELCKISGHDPKQYYWLRLNFDTSDIDDYDEILEGEE